MVYLALALGGPVLNLYTGGRWIGALIGLAFLHGLLLRAGHRGGLLDLARSARPLWITAGLLALLVAHGPLR